MLDYVLLARARKMLADEATELHVRSRVYATGVFDNETQRLVDTGRQVIVAEACQYAADSLHNVLSKADAFLDDEQAREALRHE
jgi:hypothetical protein